mmetsp:Transcript_35052/g.58951  ORF Transcript_35052/g.58951 Transcript_35052/m.58951 type:complete len:386 (-) Transcript_35052:388-1545(-)
MAGATHCLGDGEDGCCPDVLTGAKEHLAFSGEGGEGVLEVATLVVMATQLDGVDATGGIRGHEHLHVLRDGCKVGHEGDHLDVRHTPLHVLLFGVHRCGELELHSVQSVGEHIVAGHHGDATHPVRLLLVRQHHTLAKNGQVRSKAAHGGQRDRDGCIGSRQVRQQDHQLASCGCWAEDDTRRRRRRGHFLSDATCPLNLCLVSTLANGRCVGEVFVVLHNRRVGDESTREATLFVEVVERLRGSAGHRVVEAHRTRPTPFVEDVVEATPHGLHPQNVGELVLHLHARHVLQNVTVANGCETALLRRLARQMLSVSQHVFQPLWDAFQRLADAAGQRVKKCLRREIGTREQEVLLCDIANGCSINIDGASEKRCAPAASFTRHVG